MADVSTCLARFGKTLDQEDVAAIDVLKQTGLTDQQAILQHLDTLDTDLSEIAAAVEEIGGVIERVAPVTDLEQAAYHGTPHTFDRFSLDAIGTGEGFQQYGWGLYFAGKKQVAEWYRDTLSTKDGALYKVDIPEDSELMDWDAPLSEQTPQVQTLLDGVVTPPDRFSQFVKEKYGKDTTDLSKDELRAASEEHTGLKELAAVANDPTSLGRELYKAIEKMEGSPKAASEYLNSFGILGSKYLGEFGRGAKGERSLNYVIWDDKQVTIEAVNDEVQQAGELFQAGYSDLDAETKAIVDDALTEVENPDHVRKLLDELKDTPWAKQAIHGARARVALRSLIEGKPPEFDSVFEAPRAAKIRNAILNHGADAIWQYFQANGTLSHPSKPVNSVNSSFLNCEPTKACATYCYAAKGRNYTSILVRAELSDWAVRTDPARFAKEVASEYKITPEFHAGKALRLFERGDGTQDWVKFIEALNAEGVRAHVFSRRSNFLRDVPTDNVRLLSIDPDNTTTAEQNLDLPIAYIYSDQNEISWLDEYKKMGGEVQVVLPIVNRGKYLTKEQQSVIPKWAKPLTCPLDKGGIKIGKGANQWNCARCDAGGGVGCYHKNTSEAVWKTVVLPLSDIPLNKTLQELNDVARRLDPAGRKLLRKELDNILSQTRAGIDIEREGDTAEGLREGVTEEGEGVEDAGKYGGKLGYEIPKDITREPVDVAPVQADLFDTEDIADPETSEAQLKDNFFVKYKQVATSSFKVGIDAVSSPEDAAHMFAPLRKRGQEAFYVLVLDADGKPINMIRHSEGQKDFSSVDPLTIAAAVASTEGAASVWFGHNHPSRRMMPSDADRSITEKINKTLDGTGIGFDGHIIVGDGGKAVFFDEPTAFKLIDIKPAARTRTMPVTTREIRKQLSKDAPKLTSPQASLELAEGLESKDSLVLLDNQHNVVGIMPFTPEELITLREDGRVTRILTAIDTVNASAAIIMSTYDSAASNLSRMLNTAGSLRVLDALIYDGSDWRSSAQEGQGVHEDTGEFYQSAEEAADTPQFKAWAGTDAPVIDPYDINDFDFKGPGPFVFRAYHGTTNDFTEFDASVKGTKEGQFGAVNYFTSDEGDAQQNYAGEGPDLTSRIETRAEQIEQELGDNPMEDSEIADLAETHGLEFNPESETYPEELPKAMARDELAGGKEQVLEVFIRTEKPFIVGEGSPWLDFFEDITEEAMAERVADNTGEDIADILENREEYEDAMDEARWELMDEAGNPLVDAIETVARRYEGVDAQQIQEDLMDYTTEVTHQKLEEALRASEGLAYAEDYSEGGLVGYHMMGEIIQELGFDSIILKDANERFPGMSMGGNTAHIHVFDANNTNIKHVENLGTFSPTDPDIFRQEGPVASRGGFNPATMAIRLSETSDLSTFLHEASHWFMQMEKQFIRDYGETEDHQTLKEWLGADSLLNLTREQEEKLAESFEVYLREGKAPSLKLRDVFREFASWLKNVYKSLTDPRLARADLNDEVREVFDRLLATDAEIESAAASPMYDELFKSKEQAGMTDKQWAEYQAAQEKRKALAEGDIGEKVMKEWRKRQTAEWEQERKDLAGAEEARLQDQPTYKLREDLKKYPLERDAAREAVGLPPILTAEQRKKKASIVDETTDSLLVMAAKKGGLDMKEWSAQGVDEAILRKGSGFKNQIGFNQRIFFKNKGMRPDDLLEKAKAYGYVNNDAVLNDILNLVDQELSGDPVMTPAGYEADMEHQYQNRMEDEGAGPDPMEVLDRQIKKITSTAAEAVNPQEYADHYGFDSVVEMITEMVNLPPIKTAAKDAAQAQMIAKYGDFLNDGTLESEVRQLMQNEAGAKVLLAEIKALGKKVGRKQKINREYLKAEAKRLMQTMKFGEIRPDKYYRAEIKAAQDAVTAETEADMLSAKIRQISNHYLYREAVKVRDQIDKHRKYINSVKKRQYKAREVDPDYVANMKLLANAYDMRKNPQQPVDVQALLGWMNDQIIDENNFVKVEYIDTNLAAMILQRSMGQPVTYKLPGWKDMTAEQIKSVHDQLKHLRFVGGKASELSRRDLQADRQAAADHVAANKDRRKPKHYETKWSKLGDKVQKFFLSHRRLGGLMDILDGFRHDGPLQAEYEKITDASNTELDMKIEMSKKIDEAFKTIHHIINHRKKATVTKADGQTWTLSYRARFALMLNWGNTGNRTATLEGLNAKFTDEYTEADVEQMLSTMSVAELEAVNQIWTAKESLWPAMSGVSVRMSGVTPPKVEATPFMINGVHMVGGHYRLHYRKDPADAARNDMEIETIQQKSVTMTKASSLNERVGSGGRLVDLELNHLFSDIDEDIHYIAFAEIAQEMSAMFKGQEQSNPLVAAIHDYHGEPFYSNLVDTLNGIWNPPEPASGFWEAMAYVRSNLTYAYLAYSIRNIVQQPIAITNAMAQLGGARVTLGVLKYASNPWRAQHEIMEQSAFMRHRTKVVNREVREQLTRMDSIHPWVGKAKKYAFAPQTFLDAQIAFPTWIAARDKYLHDHPETRDMDRAVRFADEMVAKTIGSGLNKDIGNILNSTEMMKQVTFMGTFFNVTYNLHAENYRLMRMGKGDGGISLPEYMRRVGYMAVAPALLSVFMLADMPEEDDEIAGHLMAEIARYNLSAIFGIRDVASTFDGFTPSIPGYKIYEGIERLARETEGLASGEKEMDETTVARFIRGIAPAVPFPMASQLARTFEGIEDEDQSVWGILVEGKDRN